MSLVSNLFLIFVLLAVCAYYLAPAKVKWLVLLVFSYAYYTAGGIRYLFFILYSTVVIYCFALWIDHLQKKEADKKIICRVLVAGLLCNLGMLAVVKYSNVFVGTVNLLTKQNLPGLPILFPLGISFYTFQSTGYLVDVYWKKAEAEHNPLKLALFISFFPQLLQGPIGNYNRLAPQLGTPHAFDWNNISRGLERILWGYAKKIIIADWAGVFADAIWADPDRYNGIMFFGLLFYGIQLYADFSGGMDVVIGIGRLFGITMDENFRRPYLATSMADFWKRWHITLGEWMMNYVFYPVSMSGWMLAFGTRCKKRFGRKLGRVIPIALADLIVFFLVGIWHGASWKYVVYGLLNGGIIAFSELMGGPYRSWKKALHISGKEGWFHAFQVVRTFILVNLRWFYDRSDTLTQGNYMVKQAFSHFSPAQVLQIPAGSQGAAFVPWALLIIAAGCVVMVLVESRSEKGMSVQERLSSLPFPATAAVYLLLFVLIGLFGSTAAPKGFIYAQF